MECDLIRPAHLIIVSFESFLLPTPYPPAVFVLWFEERLLARAAFRLASVLKDFTYKVAAELLCRF
jgi:hypothetical protein